ncbi:MAG TPA: hypothetical protein VKS21_05075 [Spirochaetota bacterium]|nr:hypothetical protein [Spirochaetota bacterium]
MKKEIYLRVLILAAIIILCIPLVKLVINYADMFLERDKFTSIEIYEEKAVRYTYDADADSSLQTALNSPRNETGSYYNKNISLDEYYNEIYREYSFSDTDADIEDFYNQALKFYNNDQKEIKEINSLLEKQPAAAEVGDSADQIIGSIDNLKIVHTFDGTAPYMNKKKEQQKEKEIVDQLNREGMEAYVNEKYVKKEKYRRDSSSLKVFGKNKFFTSPVPTTRKKNDMNELDGLKLILSKEKYFSFELIKLCLVAQKKLNLRDLKIFVKRNNYIFPNVGGENDSFFKYKDKTIYSTIALGYNPSPGTYKVVVKSRSVPQWEGLVKKFTLLRRKVPVLKKGFAVVNMERTSSFAKIKIKGPYGDIGGYEKIGSWAKFMDADAFWMLTAQTTGWDNKINSSSPWVKSGFRNLDLLAPVLKSNNLQVGAYIMSYYTPAKGFKKVKGYSSSLGFSQNSRLYESSHVSLNCQNRFNDILQAMRELENHSQVDFIGIDFIRTGKADGYEMGPQVINEMNIRVPAEYHQMSYSSKVKWFARQIEKVKNPKTILKWRWWRAHRTAEIVNRLITIGNISKPVWCFTLGWEHGKQHGQDPYMMFDAGAFIDAVMLYEANATQFKNMMVQWHHYMRYNKNNLIIGNAADVRLLDGKSGHPAVEYVYRTRKGAANIYKNGFAKGVFFHDIDRALWSSKRGISTKEWAIVNGHAVSEYRYQTGLIPYKGEIFFNDDLKNGHIDIINTSDKKVEDLKISFVPTHSWATVEDNLPETITLHPKERQRYTFSVKVRPAFRKEENILGYVLDHALYRRYFFFTVRSTNTRFYRNYIEQATRSVP